MLNWTVDGQRIEVGPGQAPSIPAAWCIASTILGKPTRRCSASCLRLGSVRPTFARLVPCSQPLPVSPRQGTNDRDHASPRTESGCARCLSWLVERRSQRRFSLIRCRCSHSRSAVPGIDATPQSKTENCHIWIIQADRPIVSSWLPAASSTVSASESSQPDRLWFPLPPTDSRSRIRELTRMV